MARLNTAPDNVVTFKKPQTQRAKKAPTRKESAETDCYIPPSDVECLKRYLKQFSELHGQLKGRLSATDESNLLHDYTMSLIYVYVFAGDKKCFDYIQNL